MNSKSDRIPVSDNASTTDWTSIRLTFARQNGDVPELMIDGYLISEADRRELQHELNRNYSGLLSNVKNGSKLYRFRSPIQGVPQDAEFRVSLVRDPTNARTEGLAFIPAIVPEPCLSSTPIQDESSPTTGKPLAVAGHWSAAFMAEAVGFLSPARMRSVEDRYQSHALQAVVEELEALQHSQPNAFATLLLSGYLSLGESLSRRHDPDRASLYHFANRGFQKLLESSGESQETPTTEDSGFRDIIPLACRRIARLFGFVTEK